MDYAEHGEIMIWNQQTLQFKPFDKDTAQMPEQVIQRYMRHCVRGLHYS